MTSLRHRHETDVIQHLFLWIYRQSHVKGRITQQGFRCTTTENSRVHSRSTLFPKERSYCCARSVLLIWSSATDAIIKPTLPNSDRSHLPIHMQISNSNMSASHLSSLPVYSSKARWCLVVCFVCHVPDISNYFKNAGFGVLGGPKITDSYRRYPGRIMKVFYLESALKLLGFFHVCSMLWPSDSRVKGKHFWYRDLSLWVIYFSFSTFVFAVLLFTHYLLVIKETRHEDKAGDGCVYRQMSAFRCWTIMLNQGRSCLSRNVLPTWRAGPWMIQNPGRALTSSLLEKKKKTLMFHVRRCARKSRWQCVMCFRMQDKEERERSREKPVSNPGWTRRSGEAFIKYWETDWKMQHLLWLCSHLLGAMQSNARTFVNSVVTVGTNICPTPCRFFMSCFFFFSGSNLILEDVTSIWCRSAIPNPKSQSASYSRAKPMIIVQN